MSAGDHVASEIVARMRQVGVLDELFVQERGVEKVNAHAGERRVRPARQRFRLLRFLGETHDAPSLVHADHAEGVRLRRRHLDRAHGHVGAVLHVVRDHRAVVHLVDVIAGKDEHVRRVVVTDDVEVLVHRVGGAGVPRGFDALLRRQQLHELAELATQEAPALLDVLDQRMRLVLGEHADTADTGVDTVGQWEVDDAELSAEGDRGLGAPVRQRTEPRAATAGEDKRQGFAREPADETPGAG